MKTKKAIAKRFGQTGAGTIRHRKAGQGHFNTRETGKTTRHKRNDVTLTKGLRRTIRQFMGR
jgi:ribosomal protein L35